MQMNNKESKNFRDSLAKWHVADFELADELMQKQKRVKSFKGLIETNQTELDKIADGKSTIKTKEELESEIENWKKSIKTEDENYRKLSKTQKENLDLGYNLLTDTLMDAFANYSADVHNTDAENTLLDELVKWFTNNGVKDADRESVRPYAKVIGQKKASAKMKCKNHKHNDTLSKKAMKDVFLGAICDEPKMAKLLPTHKFVTIITSKTK